MGTTSTASRAFEVRTGSLILQFLAAIALAAGAGADSELTVVSLNAQEKSAGDGWERELRSNTNLLHADLVLLQEVADPETEAQFLPRQIAKLLDLPYCFSPSRVAADEWKSPRLAILSRYPLKETRIVELHRVQLPFKSRRRYAIDVVAEAPAGQIRVFNVHLDSRINIGDRLLQIDTVLSQIPDEKRPVLIGGDFNTNDFFWILHSLPIPFASRQEDRLLEFMSGQGFKTPFRSLGPTHDFLQLKLDWIFGRGLSWLKSGIVPLEISDHHLIWAQVRF